jgi:hypothetical protein
MEMFVSAARSWFTPLIVVQLRCRKQRSGTAARRHPRRTRFSRSTTAPIPIALSGIGAAQCRGEALGGSNGVAVDRDGKTVGDRPMPWNGPRLPRTKANPVHHLMSQEAMRSFGGGIFVWPHGIHVDRDGNVWGPTHAAARTSSPSFRRRQQGKRGRQVQPRRKILMTLGETGREGKSSRGPD